MAAAEPVKAEQLVPISDVSAAIAKGIADGMRELSGNLVAGMTAMAPPRKVEFGEFDGKSPFNRTLDGRLLTDKEKAVECVLTRKCYQNGYRMLEERLIPDEIWELNKITRPGRYIERKVEVVISDDGSDQSMDLRYKNKTADDRSELKSEVKNLVVMLKRIVAEQDEAEQEEATAPRRSKK